MAPTEILAEQHFRSLSRLLANSRLRVALLLGATPKKERTAILKGMLSQDKSDAVDLVIGTHALLTESVRFRSLAVAVIDEQHRFGVAQRARLRASATVINDAGETTTPHVLVMTATPIPRTLAITLFGDLDISLLTGMPPGRKPILTRVVAPEKRAAVYAFVRERIEAGDQAYIISPSIDDTDEPTRAELSSVKSLHKELADGPLAGIPIAEVHGRQKRDVRDDIMTRFRSGEIKAIVSTTVIEVGVDVPNATLMVIENADRFGLAQLHQLRGRVGRGDKQSVCALISAASTPDAEKRLEVMASTTDGFVLAEHDFTMRGPGEIFGTRQAGIPPFKIADLNRDRELLLLARTDAAAWIARSPVLDQPDEAVLRRRLLARYGASLGLGDVG
jgi:ATP-dependent DNA helicase RecG